MLSRYKQMGGSGMSFTVYPGCDSMAACDCNNKQKRQLMTDDTKACPACARYEITTQRVRIEQGLFSKAKETVELFRIDHFDLLKPLGMRLLGQCRVQLRSSDTNFPDVVIFGIPDLERLADTLRECSLKERARRRVTTFVQA